MAGHSAPRAPTLLDAPIPVTALIGLIALTIVIVGIYAANGPLPVALLTSAVVAGLVALKNGYTTASVRDAMVGGITRALGAVFILLAVRALIGTGNLAGTIPTVVSYRRFRAALISSHRTQPMTGLHLV